MTKRIPTLIAALAITVPSFVLAQAQSAPPPSQSTVPMDQTNMAPAPAMGVNASTGPVSADQLPAGQAQALAAGDNKMVTNGPVPDTAANRAKYGGPMSHAGKRTPPVGN